MCQNSPFIEITLATTARAALLKFYVQLLGCSSFLVYENFDTPSFSWRGICTLHLFQHLFVLL